METSQLIFKAKQLTGFYVMETLAFIKLLNFSADLSIRGNTSKHT